MLLEFVWVCFVKNLFVQFILKFENPSIFNLFFVFFYDIYYINIEKHTHNIFLYQTFHFSTFSVIIIILIKRVVFSIFFSFFKYVFALRPNHDPPHLSSPFYHIIVSNFRVLLHRSNLPQFLRRRLSRADSLKQLIRYDRPTNLYLKITMVGQLVESNGAQTFRLAGQKFHPKFSDHPQRQAKALHATEF